MIRTDSLTFLDIEKSTSGVGKDLNNIIGEAANQEVPQVVHLLLILVSNLITILDIKSRQILKGKCSGG